MTVRLLKDLFLMMKNQDAMRIINVVTAALHLACIFKGTAFTEGRLVSHPSCIIVTNILNLSFRRYQTYPQTVTNGKDPPFRSFVVSY